MAKAAEKTSEVFDVEFPTFDASKATDQITREGRRAVEGSREIEDWR